MTTRDEHGLAPEQAFEPDGHLTELCLACMADGELALVPERARDHLDACEPCARRLGDAALLSLAAGEALRDAPEDAIVAIAPAPVSPRRARRPLPLAAIAAALLVAAIMAGPSLVDATREIPRAASGVVGFLMLATRIGGTLWQAWSVGLVPLLAKCVSALVLAVLGFQVARVRTRAASWQGGVR